MRAPWQRNRRCCGLLVFAAIFPIWVLAVSTGLVWYPWMSGSTIEFQYPNATESQSTAFKWPDRITTAKGTPAYVPVQSCDTVAHQQFISQLLQSQNISLQYQQWIIADTRDGHSCERPKKTMIVSLVTFFVWTVGALIPWLSRWWTLFMVYLGCLNPASLEATPMSEVMSEDQRWRRSSCRGCLHFSCDYGMVWTVWPFFLVLSQWLIAGLWAYAMMMPSDWCQPPSFQMQVHNAVAIDGLRNALKSWCQGWTFETFETFDTTSEQTTHATLVWQANLALQSRISLHFTDSLPYAASVSMTVITLHMIVFSRPAFRID